MEPDKEQSPALVGDQQGGASKIDDTAAELEQMPTVEVAPPVEPEAAVAAEPVVGPPTNVVQENVVADGHEVAAVIPAPVVAKTSKFGKLFKLFRHLSPRKKAALVGVIGVFGILGVLGVSRLISDGTVASLVTDSKNGINFMRPANWQHAKDEDGLAYYTENGVAEADMNRGMILGVQTLGVRYSTLPEESKANIRDSFESEFSRNETLGGDQCEKITNVQTTELSKEGYDLAFKVDAECPELKDGKTGGKIKMFIGWNDVNLHVVGVVADTPTWQAEGSELDSVLSSIKVEY